MPTSSALISHLQQNVTTLCTLWRVEAADGTVIRASNHTRSITFNSEVYTPAPLQPSRNQSVAGLQPDNAEVMIVLTSSGITEADLRAKKYDGARVVIYEGVNYLSPADGATRTRVRVLGETTVKNGTAQIKVVGLSYLLSKPIGDLYSPLCRVRQLGDAECKVNLLGNTVDGTPITTTTTVTGVSSRRVFTVGVSRPDDFYLKGWVEFTSGANAGAGFGSKMEIKSNTGNSIELNLPMGRTVAIGDAVKLIAGCDRRLPTCRDKFANVINRRAEDYLPGIEKAVTFPQS